MVFSYSVIERELPRNQQSEKTVNTIAEPEQKFSLLSFLMRSPSKVKVDGEKKNLELEELNESLHLEMNHNEKLRTGT